MQFKTNPVVCSPLQRLKRGPLVMFDLVLTILKSHFLPVSVTLSSTMVKLQPLLCLYPPPSPRSLWTSLSNFMMLEEILLYRMPIQSLFSLSLSLSLCLQPGPPPRELSSTPHMAEHLTCMKNICLSLILSKEWCHKF